MGKSSKQKEKQGKVGEGNREIVEMETKRARDRGSDRDGERTACMPETESV